MSTPILAAQGIHKSFGQVRALQGADIEIHAGEVVALIGDNGAGKSTLASILSGVLEADEGEIFVDGISTRIRSPLDARSHGIETVYQDLSLALDLNPIQNVFLGREIPAPGLLGRLGFMNRRAMQKAGETAFQGLGVSVPDADSPVGNFSGGERQGVAVARAVMWAKRLVFMDEPTAALGVKQQRNVLNLIRRVRDQGIAVCLISHSMPDVLAVSDRIAVMRRGRRVVTYDAKAVTSDELVGAMTGTLELEVKS